MNIKLIQLDGKLPNLALMKLAHWHRERGDNVAFSADVIPPFAEKRFDMVYGSVIFTKTAELTKTFSALYPDSMVAGTGLPETMAVTVESVLGVEEYEHYDYSIYPEYPWSVGFTQRGCRLQCGFCVVPEKEGRPRATNTIADIWRPETDRCVVLLDNDFFGQPKEEWQARIDELREGDFRASFNQGVNIRLMTDETAQALASVKYYDDQFKRRRLYTAWDNVGQERVFFRGLEKLEAAGVPARHLLVYMLIGYDPVEDMERIMHRYRKLKDVGCMPYPMVYGNDRTLKAFQRWVIGRYDQVTSWEDYYYNPANRP